MKKFAFALCFVLLVCSAAFAATFNPGSYEGTGKGYGEKVSVKVVVTVDENAITEANISGSEEIPFGQMNFENYSKALIGRTDGDIDAVSGATMTRDGIREAVEAALAQARIAGAALPVEALPLKSGKYTASGNGMDGEVKIEVTIEDNKVQKIDIEDNETAGVGDKALAIIADQVITHQSLAVDSISGATVSSAAMKAALEDALKQAGADVKEWRARAIPTEVKDEEFTYDVVIVGAGYAGIQAALKASIDGAKVALIEKLGIVGGTSIFSSGAFVAAFTKEEIPEKVQIWINRNTEFLNKLDRDKLNKAMENAPEIIAMYAEMGINGKPYKGTGWGIDASEKAIKNASTVKLADVAVHAKGGEYLIDTLMKRLEKNGVDVFVNTPMTELITKDGAVEGVICNTKRGVKTFHSKTVVLATGTFARNAELAKELDPGSEYNFTAASKGDEGDGIVVARKLGAVFYPYQHKMSGIFAPDPYDMPVVGQPSNSYPFNCLLVTSKAERKVSETAGSHFQTEYFIEPDAPDFGWVVMDQAVADRFLNLEKYLQATKQGSPYIEAYKEDSLEALAKDMKVDFKNLSATVERYNELCKAGRDDDFGKDIKFLDPIDEGPFYAVKEYDLTRGEYGGIVTNDKAQVVNGEGKPIKGLYAAGLISSGELLGDFYPGMEALGICSYMGFIAGREAASEAAGR